MGREEMAKFEICKRFTLANLKFCFSPFPEGSRSNLSL
jgi:hypothetical protein